MGDPYVDFIAGGAASVAGGEIIAALFMLAFLVAWGVFSGTPMFVTGLFLGSVIFWMSAPSCIPYGGTCTPVGGLGILPSELFIIIVVLGVSLPVAYIFMKIAQRLGS